MAGLRYSLAVQHVADGLDDLAGGLLLVDVAPGPGTQGALGVQVLAVHRPDNHQQFLIGGLEPLDQIQTVPDFSARSMTATSGFAGGRDLDRFGQIGRLAADLQVGSPAMRMASALADGRVIINDQDPGRPAC